MNLHGATGKRLRNGRCSCCGGSGFVYSNGTEFSRQGVRGYRCLGCNTIKPEKVQTYKGYQIAKADDDCLLVIPPYSSVAWPDVAVSLRYVKKWIERDIAERNAQKAGAL